MPVPESRFSAKYLRDSRRYKLLFHPCLSVLNLMRLQAVVHFSMLPMLLSLACFGCGENRKYNTDSPKNCKRDGHPGCIPRARNTHFSTCVSGIRKHSLCFTKHERHINHDAKFQQLMSALHSPQTASLGCESVTGFLSPARTISAFVRATMK